MTETVDLQTELPISWIQAELQDCVEILDSRRVPVNNKERQERISDKAESDLFPYFGATGQVGWIDDYLFDAEMVLLGEDGVPFLDSSRPKAYLIKGKTWVNNHAHVLEAVQDVTSSEFVLYFLNQFDFHGYVTGTTRLKLNQARMRQIPVPLPPLNEQHRIVKKIEELFTKLDAGVRSLKQTQALLKSYRRSVLKAAVEGELSREWREAHQDELEPASELLERILQERREKFAGKKYKEPGSPDISNLPTLPDGWAWASLEQVSREVRYGSSEKTIEDPNGIPVMRMGNIQNGQLVADNLKYLPTEHEEFPELLLEPGDLLFNRTNSYELVGKTAVHTGTPEPCSFASYLIRVRFVSGVLSKFVAYFINSPYGRQWISSVVSQQVGQANVNGTKLKALSVPLPPQEEQRYIVEEVERRLSVVDKLEATVEANLKQAGGLRQAILERAFSGELVPQDPDDEPAGVLLGRIKAEREATGRKAGRRKTKRDDEAQGRLL